MITTATDGRGLFAVDSWAKEQNCHVMEPETNQRSIRKTAGGGDHLDALPVGGVRAAAGRGAFGEARDCDVEVTLFSWEGPSPSSGAENLGAGCGLPERCRQRDPGGSGGPDNGAVTLRAAGYCPGLLHRFEEGGAGPAGFLCRKKAAFPYLLPEELAQVTGDFTPSEFVRQVTGIDNVCERSAVLGSGGGLLLQRKCKGDGVTFGGGTDPLSTRMAVVTWKENGFTWWAWGLVEGSR